jgi:hypothetical protein
MPENRMFRQENELDLSTELSDVTPAHNKQTELLPQQTTQVRCKTFRVDNRLHACLSL